MALGKRSGPAKEASRARARVHGRKTQHDADDVPVSFSPAQEHAIQILPKVRVRPRWRRWS